MVSREIAVEVQRKRRYFTADTDTATHGKDQKLRDGLPRLSATGPSHHHVESEQCLRGLQAEYLGVAAAAPGCPA